MTILLPEFLKKNYINNVSQISDNTGGATDDTLKLRLFDRSRELRYTSIGVTTGNRIITIDFGAIKFIDRIYIQDHNMGDFKIEADGAALLQINDGITTANLNLTGNTSTLSYFQITPVNTQTLTLTCTNLIGGTNGELKLAEFYAGAQIFNIQDDVGGEIDIQAEAAQSLIELSDATQQKLFIRRTTNYQISLENVTQAHLFDYINLYQENRQNSFAFVVRPAITHPSFAPDDLWDGLASHYNWTNPLDIYTFTDSTGRTFNVNIDLIEAGGLD